MALTLATFLDALTPDRQPVASIWRALGVQRKELQQFIATHRDELAAAGVQLHGATTSQASKPTLHLERDGRRYAAISLPVVDALPAVVPSSAPLATLDPQVVRSLDLAIAAWLDSKRQRSGSERTFDAYAETLAAFRQTLTAAGIDLDSDPRAVGLVAQRWAQSSKAARDVKPSTVRQRLAIVSSFYVFACKRGLLPCDNPIAALDRPQVQSYADAQALDPADVRRRLRQIDRTDPQGQRDYALLYVALTTGRRLSELAGLRWSDVQIAGDKVTLTFRRAKGGKTMRDALDPKVSKALMAWLHAHYGKALGELPPTKALWVSLSRRNDGEPLGVQSIDDVCRKRLGCHPHALRHTFARQMEQAGARVSEIQARLGHESLETTGRYLRALGRDENAHAGQLADLFGGDDGE